MWENIFRMQRNRNSEKPNSSIQSKLVVIFIFTSAFVFAVNLFMFVNINSVISKIDRVYLSNAMLNELADALTDVQNDMIEYLNTKNSDAIEDYYGSQKRYREKLDELSTDVTSNEMGLMEKNIRNLSESYLEQTEETVQNKRGRMIEKYNSSYDSAKEIYKYINSYIYSLNNAQFKYNSANYNTLLTSFKSLEIVTFTVLIMVTIANVFLALVMTKSITRPLSDLALRANEIAAGNFDVDPVTVESSDEIGVVSRAFNKMIVSIQDYVVRLRQSMEVESAMREKELMMETHLKDAELKYLQAQIDPHFLFNTLNAGAQLAMMEEADRTYDFIQNMAAFYRYSIKKDKQNTTLLDELRLVDNYIYILNVRFSGDIHFQKEIDESLVGICVPSMILQPIVENAVNYGVRDIEWEGLITLRVRRENEYVCVSVHDNGAGMTQERIAQVMEGRAGGSGDSNGVGLFNVISRLRLCYGREEVLAITSPGPGKGTEVTILFPLD